MRAASTPYDPNFALRRCMATLRWFAIKSLRERPRFDVQFPLSVYFFKHQHISTQVLNIVRIGDLQCAERIRQVT